MQEWLRLWIHQRPTSFCKTGIDCLVSQWDKCINTLGNYFWVKEILLSLCSGCSVFIWLLLKISSPQYYRVDGNGCHPFNSRRGRLKGPIYIYIYIYNMGSKLDSFLRKGCFFFSFVYVVLLIPLEIMRKKITSVGLSYKDVLLFSKNILSLRCSLRKIK